MSIIEDDVAAATDRQLLISFQRKRDPSAFSELVKRYHSMVHGVAQRMLGCFHLADDVTQATFMVLAKDARKIRNRQALASWLSGVAFRIAARQVKQRARRNTLTLKEDVMVSDDPLERLSAQFEQTSVFEELHRLPEKLRGAMVLRYLQGQSNAEVAESLGLSESAVEGRLKRGRDQLRVRLARQGVTFASAILVLRVTQKTLFARDPNVVSQTVEACLSAEAGANCVNGGVVQLANEEITKMAMSNLIQQTLVACAAVGVLTVGLSTVAGIGQVGAQETRGEVVLRQGDGAEQNGVSRRAAQFEATRSTSKAKEKRPASQVASVPNASGTYSLDEPSAAEKRISTALQQPTNIRFEDAPLQEIIARLAELHRLQIVIDEEGIASEGVASNTLASIDLSDVKLKSGLSHLLRPLNLAATVRNEVLVITGKSQALEHMITKVYRTNYHWNLEDDQLVAVVENAVMPDSWSESGGPGRISVVEGGLVIRACREAHEKINDLFKQLDRAYQADSVQADVSSISQPQAGGLSLGDASSNFDYVDSAVYPGYRNRVPSELDWAAYESGLAAKLKGSGLMIVNFTADWCVRCQANKRSMAESQSFRNLVNERQAKLIEVDVTAGVPQLGQRLQLLEQLSGSQQLPYMVILSGTTDEASSTPGGQGTASKSNSQPFDRNRMIELPGVLTAQKIVDALQQSTSSNGTVPAKQVTRDKRAALSKSRSSESEPNSSGINKPAAPPLNQGFPPSQLRRR